MRFEWDEAKNRRNLIKHKISFETAKLVFEDPHALSLQERFVEGEERWQTLGSVGGIIVVAVAHTYWEEHGEEVIRIMTDIRQLDGHPSIMGQQKIVTCPGRKRTDTSREGKPGTYVDGDPVDIRLGALRIGNIALTSVDAELYSAIGLRLKRESPLADTMLVTLANGRADSGYIPNDAAFGALTFQVLGSRLQPGCAETAIVDGLLDLIAATQK